ncbi:uncharacterized protein SCHCODRAFT_02493371 [Schizophyllum commune H4-8]|nr:uncharacterized protein SCHCODRAFT_02493371 [Schizophyllum commune H4-8]KAI5895915.1 hypothetical protein SCHCODRAFT_02493371 [Schizophyllum commune H4-8]
MTRSHRGRLGYPLSRILKSLDIGLSTHDIHEVDAPVLLSARGPPDKASDDDAEEPARLDTSLEQVSTDGEACLLAECHDSWMRTRPPPRTNVKQLEARPECAYSLWVTHARCVHCASPTSALNPRQKDHEMDVPDARALSPLRGSLNKRVGSDIGVLRAEKLLCSPSPCSVKVSNASVTGYTSCLDRTPRPGENVSLSIEDGECKQGYALPSYDNSGGRQTSHPQDMATPRA